MNIFRWTKLELLVTGGMGFIGSAIVKHALDNGCRVTVLDKFTYAADEENLAGYLDNKNLEIIEGDICDPKIVSKVMSTARRVIHCAAESHVDNSIENGLEFAKTNVLGTTVLLNEAIKHTDIKSFVMVSTDEIYGPINGTDEAYIWARYNPCNPYAATKAGSEHLALAYQNTYNFPIIVTRSCNNFGPGQNCEKLIPKVIEHAMNERPIPVYGTGLAIREWIYVEDNARRIYNLCKEEYDEDNCIYNIGSGVRFTNLQLIYKILDIMDKPKTLINFVEDRPGHDMRYAIKDRNTDENKWEFERALYETVEHYVKKFGG